MERFASWGPRLNLSVRLLSVVYVHCGICFDHMYYVEMIEAFARIFDSIRVWGNNISSPLVISSLKCTTAEGNIKCEVI